MIHVHIMKIKKFFPFLLAILIFIISNFIQKRIGDDKKNIQGGIARIEKDLTSFLQYNSISTLNYNFAQVHLNGVIEKTYEGNTDLRKMYMTEVTDQMSRALSALNEAAKTLSEKSSEDIIDVIDKMKSSNNNNSFIDFYDSYMLAIEKSTVLTKKINEKIESLGYEKIELRRTLSALTSKETIVLNITIALNFLILLFAHIEKKDKKKPMVNTNLK